MEMHTVVRNYIYTLDNASHEEDILAVVQQLDTLCRRAYADNDEAALLDANRVLYVINLAHLSMPWVEHAHHVNHPHITRIKYAIETAWEKAEREKYRERIAAQPLTDNFPDAMVALVHGHSSNDVHPLYRFLRDEATFPQLRQFTLQETPLEMLFGDIVALMMPGVYGVAKVELAKNFWDEVGRADEPRIHRNLRAHLMHQIDIEPDFYERDVQLFVREELSLVNMYLSAAMDRSKLTQLVGVMLATELMIPGRFEHLIEGWERLGLKQDGLAYLTEHVTVDAEHAQDWLYKVVQPMLQKNPAVKDEVLLGIMRRLDTAADVSDRLMALLKNSSYEAEPQHINAGREREAYDAVR